MDQYRFLIAVTVTDEYDEGRQKLHRRLENAIDHGTARDALADALNSDVSLKLVSEYGADA